MEEINYYDLIENYRNSLAKRIGALEARQAKLPNLRLKLVRRGGNIFFNAREEGANDKPIYVSKKDNAKVVALVNASYIRQVLPKLRKNLAAAEKFLCLHSGIEEQQLAEDLPMQLQELNNNLYVSKALYIAKWQAVSYERNPYKPENMIHSTIRGDVVRSKSEAMIANALYSHRLPYLLERPLVVRQWNKKIYPDFTILNPITRQEVYWEHFGMMGDQTYAADACRRIQMMDSMGIRLGENLICTFESQEVPLSSTMVESYIKQYFL